MRTRYITKWDAASILTTLTILCQSAVNATAA
jgi:hypothetical protein